MIITAYLTTTLEEFVFRMYLIQMCDKMF